MWVRDLPIRADEPWQKRQRGDGGDAVVDREQHADPVARRPGKPALAGSVDP